MRQLNRTLIFGLLLLGLLTSCGGGEDANQDEPVAEQAIAIEAQPVQTQTLPQQVEYSGNIEAWEAALVAGQTGVRIDKVHVQEGAQVRKGQVLVTMNSTQLNQARIQLDLARRQVHRLDTLYRIGSVSGQQFDQAQTELQNAEANYNNLAQNTRLTANFNGIVINKYFTDGELFVPGANSPAILNIVQIEPVKVTINVSESYFTRVQEGMRATITSDAYADEEFTGNVYRKSPTIDRTSRTFQAEIRIENKDRRLRPGMFARVSLNLGEMEGIYVPTVAIVRQPGTSNEFVYMVDQQNRARRVQVTTGPRYRELIKIASGLEPGQTVVTEGMAKLNEGALVRTIESAPVASEE